MKLFEVFDSVTVPEELRRIFNETEVLKLSASRHHGDVTVHIESERLLAYQKRYSMTSFLKAWTSMR